MEEIYCWRELGWRLTPKNYEETGGWRWLCNEDHLDVYCTANVIRAIRRRVYEMGVPVARMEVTRKAKEMWSESLKEMEASK